MLQDMNIKLKQNMHGVRVKFQQAEKQNEILQKDNAELGKFVQWKERKSSQPNCSFIQNQSPYLQCE